ncbi:MAG: VWA domain-containing protein [Betaproteobacteria bacterium]|nr:VWA domain-containing protein [Betaproteobacteria bacterium]
MAAGHDLEAYGSLTEGMSREHLELVRAAWPDARAVFGPSGLDAYLRAVRALESIGVTWSTIVTYLREAPRVAREAGEPAVRRLNETALSVYGYTNQATMEGLLTAAPVAARRLREPRAFAAFLALVSELAERAPRGLPAMLRHVNTLLDHLRVEDLRKWALLGIQAHSRDLFAQESYFDLKTPEARAFLRADSGGVQFTDVRKRLGLYLRALWGRGSELRGFPVTLQQSRPFITPLGIHLPDAYRAVQGETGVALYRAAAAHAAAHLAFSGPPQERGGLKPIQIVLVGLLEDARVEWLASREIPGLQRLWLRFHEARPTGGATFADLAVRLARALLDPAYEDDSPWVRKARKLFFESGHDLSDPGFVRGLGSSLGNDIGQMRLQFNAKTWVIEPMYRDDNTFLWEPDKNEQGLMMEEDIMLVQPEVIEADGGDTLESPDAEEAEGVRPTGAGDPDSDDQAMLAGDLLRIVHYPEWDHLISLMRPQWCTVQEKRPEPGDPAVVGEILHRHQDLLDRIDALIRGSELRKPVRLRKQMDGDRFDLDQVVNAMIDVRSHRTPDPRFHVRIDRRERDLSVLVLLDLSESTNDVVKASGKSVLHLAREATVLLAAAMERIGDQFAIHGFCSNGRGEVQYYRFKDFGWPFDDHVKARVAGMKGQLSTRMGGALRHATQWLRYRACDKKLILLVTDGEPHDIDVHDPKYLLFDAKKAVEEASRAGIFTYCMSLDPRADEYVSRIFGARNYTVVDHINRLPEKLPGLYLRLTR